MHYVHVATYLGIDSPPVYIGSDSGMHPIVAACVIAGLCGHRYGICICRGHWLRNVCALSPLKMVAVAVH